MAQVIMREQVEDLVNRQSAQLLDVLPFGAYEREHIQGAITLPLKRLDRETAAQLDAKRPLITYCHDAA